MFYTYISAPILQFGAYIFASILYIVGWKESTLKQNIKFIRNQNISNPANLLQERNQSFQKFHRFKFLFNLSFDLLAFLWCKITPDIAQSKIQIPEASRLILKEIRENNQHNIPHILYSMHYGNFELMATILSQQNLDLIASIHPLHSRTFSKLLQKLRSNQDDQKTNLYTFDFKNNIQHLIQLLKNGKTIGWMIDQNPQKQTSTLSSFLNIQTQWNPIPKYLEEKFQPKTYLCILHRNRKFQHELHVKKCDKLYPDSFSFFENQIFKNPNQYYGFSHRRFKNSHPEIYSTP